MILDAVKEDFCWQLLCKVQEKPLELSSLKTKGISTLCFQGTRKGRPQKGWGGGVAGSTEWVTAYSTAHGRSRTGSDASCIGQPPGLPAGYCANRAARAARAA